MWPLSEVGRQAVRIMATTVAWAGLRRAARPSNVVPLRPGLPAGPFIKRGGRPSRLVRWWYRLRLAVELCGWLSWGGVALALLLR